MVERAQMCEMCGKLADVIDAVVVFEGRRFRPLRFRWRGRVCKVVEITARWQTRNGYSRIHHFTTRDESSNYYQIAFDGNRGVWSLTRSWSE